jgi:hypothetical protein
MKSARHPVHRLFACVLTPCLILSAAIAAAATASHAVAQDDGAVEPYPAIVIENDVYIRSGAGSSYYPFGKLRAGDIVTVTGDRFGWARVLTRGHAFTDFFGYVNAEHIRLGPGSTGTTLGLVDVLAPHMDRGGDPDSSWKWIARLPAESTVVVLGQVKGSKTNFCRVALPDTGVGFVSAQFLRAATTEEVAAWERLAGRSRTTESEPTEEVVATPPTAIGDDAPAPTPSEIITPSPTSPPAAATPDPIGSTDDQSPAAEANRPVEIAQDAVVDGAARPLEDIDAPPAAPQKTLADVTFEDLESAYESLKKADIRVAEIAPLRERYVAYVESKQGDQRQQTIAKGRVQLLEARAKLQEQVLSLDEVRARASLTTQDVESARIAVERAADYTAVGRIAASSIYDGIRLPHLLRMIDPASGRTIAYIDPTGDFDFPTLIGQLVGVVGPKSYDGGLRLTVIDPQRVDILTPGSE